MLPGGLGEECILPPLHVFGSHVFYVGGDTPLLSEWVGQLPIAVAPKHVLQGHIDSRASRDGTVKNRIGIGYV